MKNISIIFTFNFFLLLAALFVVLTDTIVWAQNRNLPKASFPNFAGTSASTNNSAGSKGSASMQDSSWSDLPSSAGVHLTEGLDRKRGAAVETYNPGEPDKNMALVRWEKKSMPLLIWISPGLKLPECTMQELKNIRVDFVTQLLQNQNPFEGMTAATGWTMQMNDQAAAGFEEWRQFENEGLFSFAFTDDPRNAHICVFFTDVFKDGNAPGGIAIGGNTCAQIYPISLAHSMNIRQKPVVIELSTLVNNTPAKMMGAAAHEFGHALGIKAHSPYREDLMYGDRIVDSLSEADKATIRWLYHQQPEFVM